MKCPNCGKWNQSSLPHCFYCGESLEAVEAYFSGRPPAWQAELKDRASAYLRVDEDGNVDATQDPRDALAKEMAELKARNQGDQAAKPAGGAAQRLALRAHGAHHQQPGHLFLRLRQPGSHPRPVDPALIEGGWAGRPNRTRKNTAPGYGPGQRGGPTATG